MFVQDDKRKRMGDREDEMKEGRKEGSESYRATVGERKELESAVNNTKEFDVLTTRKKKKKTSTIEYMLHSYCAFIYKSKNKYYEFGEDFCIFYPFCVMLLLLLLLLANMNNKNNNNKTLRTKWAK